MKATITDLREIEVKRRYIRECRTTEEIAEWRRAIRENGGERFDGESALVAEVEARCAVEGKR